ncbi:MAG: acetyl-CoA carboxylase biotin carboxyl carrier protein subunit [Acidimicrobiia bacterium]|nr:acetyl-CoA carboxylase biotin carboxyl carrier protein subunit [Acidimicrobiia bacterium]
MHDIRAGSPATVIELLVDEGQMVAELDALVILDSSDGEVVVITEVPGVVREIHVEPGSSVTEGSLIALIDES